MELAMAARDEGQEDQCARDLGEATVDGVMCKVIDLCFCFCLTFASLYAPLYTVAGSTIAEARPNAIFFFHVTLNVD